MPTEHEIEFAATLAANPQARDAKIAADNFRPRAGVDYEWVSKYAQARYAESSAALKELDDKAGAVAGYVASGAGLLTLGSLAALSSPQIHPLAILFTLPSLACAILSVRAALKARETTTIYPPPSVPAAAELAHHYELQPGSAEGVFAFQWYLCAVLMRPAILRKAERVDAAIWNLLASLVFLTLPVVVSLIFRLIGDPAQLVK